MSFIYIASTMYICVSYINDEILTTCLHLFMDTWRRESLSFYKERGCLCCHINYFCLSI